MRIVHEKEAIRQAKEEICLEQIMDHTELPCAIHIYEKGEFITSPENPSRYLLFCMSGSVKVYDLDSSSSIIPIAYMERTYLIGDMEFTGDSPVNYYVEAITTVRCLAMELSVCRETLDGDVRFLHFLLRSIREKLVQAATVGNVSDELTERLLRYMTLFCPERRLSGVSKAAVALHCSRRQLQRVLVQLCEDGILCKEKKGTYLLRENTENS